MQTLFQEIKQTRPFPSLEAETYISIRLTARLMEEPWDRFLRKTVNLSPSQYNLLRILRGAGVEGRTMGEIADRMINRDPDVTRLADRTAKLGLARRQRDEADRRVVKLFITQDGLDLLDRLEPKTAVFLTAALGGLGEEKQRQLNALLAEVREHMRHFPAEALAEGG